jgi:hypothetical protein
MGNRLPRGLGGRGHWLDMLGVGEEKVNAPGRNRIVGVTVRRERRWTSAGATPARELVRSTR